MKSKIVACIAGVCIAIAALLYASPYIALRSIAKAIERKDADTVAEYVDFPALRENIKGYMLLKVQEQMQSPQMQNNPFAGLGQVMAVGLVNQLTESLVSPAGVMLMLERGKPGKPTDVAAAGAGVDTQTDSSRKDFSVDYNGWSKIFVHTKNQPGGFIFKREGLMGWKLVAVKMD